MTPAGARRRIPAGLRDSKLVPELRRADVAARAAAWVSASAVRLGDAAPRSTRSASCARSGWRRSGRSPICASQGVAPEDAIVLLDGNYDYITPAGATGLHRPARDQGRPGLRECGRGIRHRQGGARRAHDASCTTSIPNTTGSRNKGYASPDHREAIQEHGSEPPPPCVVVDRRVADAVLSARAVAGAGRP